MKFVYFLLTLITSGASLFGTDDDIDLSFLFNTPAIQRSPISSIGDSTSAITAPNTSLFDLSIHPRPLTQVPAKVPALLNAAGTAPKPIHLDDNGGNSDSGDKNLTALLNELAAAQNRPPVHTLPPPPAPVGKISEGMSFDQLIDELIKEMHQSNPATRQQLSYWGNRPDNHNSAHEKELLRSFFQAAYSTHMDINTNSLDALNNYQKLNPDPLLILLSTKFLIYFERQSQPITEAHHEALQEALGLSSKGVPDEYTLSKTMITTIKVFIDELIDQQNLKYGLAEGCRLERPPTAIAEAPGRLADLANARFVRKADAPASSQPNGGSCRPETIILDNNDKSGGGGSHQPPVSRPFCANLLPSVTQGSRTNGHNRGSSQPPQNNGNQATLEAHAQHPKRVNFFDAVARFRQQNAIESEDGALNRFELEGHLNEILRHELHAIVDRYEKSIPIDEFDFQRFMNALEDDLTERGFNVEALGDEAHFREVLAHELHALIDLNEKSISADHLDLEALLKEETVLERMETVLAERGWLDSWRESALNAIVDSYDALALQEKAEAFATEAFVYANGAMKQVNRLAVAAMLLALEYQNPVGREGALVSWN